MPLPLVPVARYTPFKSTYTVPKELMQSMHSFRPSLAHKAFKASKSLRTPVEVSQWTAQTHIRLEVFSIRCRTALRLKGAPQGASYTSEPSPHRRAWSTKRVPNAPLFNTRPRPPSRNSCPPTASLANVPEPIRIWHSAALVNPHRRSFVV